MKAKILLVFIVLSFCIKPIKSFAQVNVQDSLALVDLYNSTGHWYDPKMPVDLWVGVQVDQTTHRVYWLDLPGQNLTGAIPASFGNLTELESVDLSHNNLTSIPNSIGNLINITSLSLQNNMLAGPIPETLGRLIKLETLHLSYNNLTSIPDSLRYLINLTTLDLSYNKFSGPIPSCFETLTKLMGLWMGWNNFTGNIPDYFGSLTNLTVLWLTGSSLSGPIPEGLSSDGRPYNNYGGGGMYLAIGYAKYNFNNIEPFAKLIHEIYDSSAQHYGFEYSPEANIPVHRYNNKLAVSAGGTLSNDTFSWYKDSVLVATITGDSTYAPSDTGRYYVTITNSVATDLTLYGDELALHYIMPDSLVSTTQNITGTSPANITKSIFEIAMLQPTAGVNQLTGNVSALVNVDTTVQTFHSQPYVQRHYDITPAVNAANAQATVSLYFTQNDFDNYNNYVTANTLNLPLLPSGGVDNGNVRITQFHGNFTGSSRPDNYNNQNAVLIVPTSVAWDNANQWWAVTFPVTGFSGFFLSTGNFTLPLTLLEFNGKVHEHTIALEWLTTHQVNTKEFVIERSVNGTMFNNIGNVTAHSISINNQYNFIDLNPLSGNSLYRLKMIDKDGKFTYSNIIQVRISNTVFELSVYPNPSSGLSTLLFSSNIIAKYIIELTDQSGKIIKNISGVSAIGINKVAIVVPNSARGIYNLTLIDAENTRHSLKVNNQ